MRTTLSFCLLLLFAKMSAQAPHYITGGEVYYTYQGMQNGEHVYRVSFQCYRTCPGVMASRAIVSIYDRITNALIKKLAVPISNLSEMKQTGDPLNDCIANPPSQCIVEATYAFEISLPISDNGYTIACILNPTAFGPVNREAGIINLAEWGGVVATYTAEIPGGAAAANSSPRISGDELTINCENSAFSFNFGAFDSNGDELRYYLSDAYRAGLNADNYIDVMAPPPFQPVIYAANFSGNLPLGPNVTVDEKLGILKGIAPGEGSYLVCVCVAEYRNGVLIAIQRREFQINVTSCKVAKASLPPEYLLCKDNNTLQLSNLSDFRVEAFNWQIFSNSGAVLFTDNKPTVSYTFADTGVYSVKLVINKGANQCIDSATSVVKVYPGLKPDFVFSGDCISSPTSFTNISTSTLGQINYWKWDFGDGGAWGNAAYGRPDVTGEYSPTYQYLGYGPSTVQLVVGTTYGCRDTLRRTINIFNKPPVNMIYKDKVICLGDTTELWAFTPAGNKFSWTPPDNMINSNSDKPLVSPAVNTVYYVRVENAAGCYNIDSVRVRVTDKVFVQAMNDTTICQGDSIQLKAVSDALTYSWTNVAPEKANLRNPVTTIHTTTDYVLTASIGGCLAKDTVRVVTAPYPRVNTGADIMICDQTSAQLDGSTDGSSFSWSPATTLNASNILDPVARPQQTTRYVLTAFGTGGCPKPAHDTVLVTVLPPIKAFAGRDTTAFVGVPMQLNASGGVAYEWSPAIGLSATNVRNPVAMYSSSSDGTKYKVKVINEAGCADSAYITVKVYTAKPQVYVPTAFTPNGDGKNDVLRPIAAGVHIEYFHVYNRWGQLVFSTKTAGQGWDGTINGKTQTTGVFTWVVKAVDVDGKPYFQKGTVTLIR